MRAILIVAFLMLLGLHGAGQSQNIRRYNCVFKDTIFYPVRNDVFKKAAAEIVQNSGLPDTMTEKLAFDLQMSSVMTIPMQIQTRIVDARIDSTIVQINPKVVHKGLTIPGSFKKLVLRKGRTISSILGINNGPVALPSFEQRNFVKTGRSKTILGYPCDEYNADEDSILIWVTKALPSTINPGVGGVNIEGAILGFRLIKEYQVYSVLKSIDSSAF